MSKIPDLDWQPFDTAPPLGSFLVWLEEPMCGTYIHSMSRQKISNGILGIIGCYFEFDCPTPKYWASFNAPEE